MVFLTEEEMRCFRKTHDMSRRLRGTFTEALLRKFTFVEKAESPRFPTMMAAVGVSNHVIEEYESWAKKYGNPFVLSDPDYSQRAFLATLKRKHCLTFIKFDDFLRMKRERFDPGFREIKRWVEREGWKRFGRRPKYTSTEAATVGFFGIIFPFSRREIYLIFRLPSIRELFGVKGEISFTMACSFIEQMNDLLPLIAQRV